MNRYALGGANPIGFVELDGHMVGKIGGAGGSINGPSPGLKLRRPWVRCSTGGCPHAARSSTGGGINPMRIRRMTVGMGDNKAREEFNARYANLPYGCAFGGQGVTNAGVTCNHPVVSAPCTAYTYCKKSHPKAALIGLSLLLTAGAAAPEELGGEALVGAGEGAATSGAAEADASMLARLPEYADGKTSGILDTESGQVELESGYGGPTSRLPRVGNPGMNWRIRSHVEAHAAAVMREQGLDEATLYINRVPCGGASGCQAMLPRMLPAAKPVSGKHRRFDRGDFNGSAGRRPPG